MTEADRARLTQLIEKWRDAAKWEAEEMSNPQRAQTLDQCADELAALLLAEDGPHPE